MPRTRPLPVSDDLRAPPTDLDPIAPFGRPPPGVRATIVKLADAMRLASGCPLPACRRAGRCRDPDGAQLPVCFWLGRALFRRAIAYVAERNGRTIGLDGTPERAADEDSRAPDAVAPTRGARGKVEKTRHGI